LAVTTPCEVTLLGFGLTTSITRVEIGGANLRREEPRTLELTLATCTAGSLLRIDRASSIKGLPNASIFGNEGGANGDSAGSDCIGVGEIGVGEIKFWLG